MREKIYKTVHIYDGNVLSIIYKYFMICVIILSLIPLTAKDSNSICVCIDIFCVIVYIIDYVLRWMTADYKFGIHEKSAFLRYPFRLISVIDVLSIFALLCSIFEFCGINTAIRVLSVFRIVRIFRYSKSIRTIINIFKKTKKTLGAVGGFAIGYIVISAIVMFNVEPESFNSFFDAVYWATVSLTTVGYGDIYPVTVMGKLIAMLSSFFGIAIVALPAGVVTAEYMNLLRCDCQETDGK